MEKDTEELENDLKTTNINGYLEQNGEELAKYTLAEFLDKLLREKHLKKAEVIKNSMINEIYAYHIFGGQRKNPSRNKIIAIAFAMGLNTKETERLLYYAGCKRLYARDVFDSVIYYALENHKTLAETESLLAKMGLKSILEKVD